VIVSACSSPQNPVESPDVEQTTSPLLDQGNDILSDEVQQDLETDQVLEEPTVTPTGAQIEDLEEQSEAYPAPGYPEPVPTIDLEPYPSPEELADPPPVKTALEATDPSEFVQAAGKPQLIEFFAFWWTRCQELAPVVHGLESEYYNRINFIYLDVDDPANENLKQQYEFRYQPQLILLDGEGQIVKQWIGPIPREEFVQAFEEILQQ
jgi:thiol-disulfide isomerase/thioredoxin